MTNLVKRISHFGTSLNHPRWKNRSIIITNNLALICAVMVLLLAVIHAVTHGGESVILVGVFLVMIFLSIPYINKLGKVNTSRTLLTCCLILGTLLFTIARKLGSVEMVSMNTFYQSRTAILVFSIIPFATIHYTERWLLAANLAIGFLALLLFDPIHNALG